MLLIGGKERTEEEFQALFQATGFELMRIVPTPSPVSIVEGRKSNSCAAASRRNYTPHVHTYYRTSGAGIGVRMVFFNIA